MGFLTGYLMGSGEATIERSRASDAELRAEQARLDADRADRSADGAFGVATALVKTAGNLIAQRDDALAEARKLRRQRDAYRQRFLEERAMRRNYQLFTLAAKQVFVDIGMAKDTTDDAMDPVVLPTMRKNRPQYDQIMEKSTEQVDTAHPVED